MRNAIIGFVVFIVMLLGAAASARPPATEPGTPAARAAEAPEVGKVRLRDRIVPLTRASLAEGGAARELDEAFAADVMADIDHDHRKSTRSED